MTTPLEYTRMIPRVLVTLLFLFVTVAGSAQATTAERFLVPLYVREPAPGALGSRWVTEVSVFNGSESPIQVGYDPICPVATCTADPVPPRVTFQPALPFFTNEPIQGVFLYVARAGAETLQVNLRVRDVSVEAEGWGTEVPVVRESEAFDRDFQILDVPIKQGYRQMLRVYEFATQTRPGNAVVRVYGTHLQGRPLRADELLAERLIAFRYAEFGGGTFNHPGYAQVTDVFDGLDGRFERIRVEVSPVIPGSRLWAFVSVTNNISQQVTAVSPQP